MEITNKKGLNLLYYPQFYDKEGADYIFKQLEKDIIYNSDEESKVRVFGKQYYIPRKQVGYGDEGTTYSFAGTKVKAKPWLPILEDIREKLFFVLGEDYNFVLVNKYRDGNDMIHYHRDDEKDLGNNPKIASLSFGATREFVFKCIEDDSIETYDLNSGDLIVMCDPTNKKYKHSISKDPSIKSPRINLTFRNIIL